MPRCIYRLSSVKVRTGLSRSTIYSKIKDGTFPAPIPLGARAVGWLSRDIDLWIDACVAQSCTRKSPNGRL